MSRVVTDVFPATVGATFPDGRTLNLTDCRVIVADGVLHALTVTSLGVAPALSGPIMMASWAGPWDQGTASIVGLTDGTAVTVRRSSGCGCGSPLRHFDVGLFAQQSAQPSG